MHPVSFFWIVGAPVSFSLSLLGDVTEHPATSTICTSVHRLFGRLRVGLLCNVVNFRACSPEQTRKSQRSGKLADAVVACTCQVPINVFRISEKVDPRHVWTQD